METLLTAFTLDLQDRGMAPRHDDVYECGKPADRSNNFLLSCIHLVSFCKLVHLGLVQDGVFVGCQGRVRALHESAVN